MLNERDIPQIQKDLQALPEAALRKMDRELGTVTCFATAASTRARAEPFGSRLHIALNCISRDANRLSDLTAAEIKRRIAAAEAEARSRQAEEDDYRRRHPNAQFSTE